MCSKCLDGLGEFKDIENHIELDPNKLRVQTQCKVALSVEFRLKKESDQIGKQGIFDKHTEWLNNLVINENTINAKIM